MEQAQPRVAQLIQTGEDLLEKGNEVSAQALTQNLENLKSRWDMVTARATEKKDKLEQALEQVSQYSLSLIAACGLRQDSRRSVG